MIGCCLFAMAQAVDRFAGTRLDLYVVSVVGMLAALPSFYTQGLAATHHIEGVRKWLFDGLELALLLVLARLGVFASDVVTGRPGHFNFFNFDSRWVLVMMMMFLAWLFAKIAATQFGRLHKLPQEHKETEYIDRSWVSPYERLKALFLQGGIVLMFFAGIVRMDLAQLQNMTGPAPVSIILNALIYFSTGLILLAQAHFDGARRRWFVDEVKVAPETGSRWMRYSFILIGLAAIFAFLVPVSYTVGLLDALRPVLEVFSFIMGLVLGLLMLIAALFGYLFVLLFGTREEQPPDTPPGPPLPEVPPAAVDAGGGFLDWLNALDWASIQSMLSWLIAIAVIVYVARSYLRDHADISIRMGQVGILRFLGKLWEAVWKSVAGMAEDAGEIRDDLVQRLLGRWGVIRQPIGRLFGLGGLSPRERMRSLYLTILNRAASRGIGRKRDQTPYEYEGVLAPRVPDVEEDVVQLTEAFIEARYSQRPVEDGDIAPAYEAWLRLRSALKRARPGH